VIQKVFSTPRPEPTRLLPILAGAGVIVIALPIFVAAGWPLAGWTIAAVLWAAGELLTVLLTRLRLGADNLAASSVVGIGMTFRAVAIGAVLIAVAASDTRLGLSAALLYAIAYTVELGVSLAVYFGSEAR
jgi:hypothetical protein